MPIRTRAVIDPVDPAVLPDCAHHARQHAPDRAKRECGRRKNERRAKPLDDFVEHRPIETVRTPKIAVKNVVEPDEILHRQRAIEPHLCAQARQALGGRVAAEDGERRIARDQSHDQEDDEGKPDKDRDQREEPPRNEAEHRSPALEMQEDRTALVGPQPARDARAPDPI